MKTFLALSFLSLLSCSCIGGVRLPAGPPASYEYSLSGMRAAPMEWYRAETLKDGSLRLLVLRGGDDDVLIVRPPEDLFQQIDSLVRQYGLNRLKSHYQPPVDIRDGNSWSVHIRYPEGDNIHSDGYHRRPRKELQDGIAAINALLRQVAEAATGEDILGHANYRDLDW